VPQSYLLLFDTLPHGTGETLARAERVLANSGFVYSGVTRKFERGKDGVLYYRIETVDTDTLSEGLQEAADANWPGVAFECRYLGKDVTVSFFAEGEGTIMVVDEEDTVLFLKRYDNPIHVVIAEDLFAYEDGAVFDLDRWRIKSTTSGFTIVTWLHPS